MMQSSLNKQSSVILKGALLINKHCISDITRKAYDGTENEIAVIKQDAFVGSLY